MQGCVKASTCDFKTSKPARAVWVLKGSSLVETPFYMGMQHKTALCWSQSSPSSSILSPKAAGISTGLERNLNGDSHGIGFKAKCIYCRKKILNVRRVKYCWFGQPSRVLQVSYISQQKTCCCLTKAQWFRQGRQEFLPTCCNKPTSCVRLEDTESQEDLFPGNRWMQLIASGECSLLTQACVLLLVFTHTFFYDTQ